MLDTNKKQTKQKKKGEEVVIYFTSAAVQRVGTYQRHNCITLISFFRRGREGGDSRNRIH